MLGSFTGKCSGSIRSIVRHPDLPVVFLKQHVLHVLFDSNFIVEDTPKGADSLPSKEETIEEISDEEETIEEISDEEEIEAIPLKRKKSSRNKENVIDGSEKKKRVKESDKRKKTKGNDGNKKTTSKDKGSKLASKKKKKSSI
ncbi:transducin/WD-like repeat-protein [Trifolium pratense]|uniref:Transducin/WD-like repeat-protein n=1 Tax=Trifolium pratense TaxID=57577 RepID=A0A2K3MQI3_TRIPR|nr:transducin/WD-like repeat-protein [Trifolium pratense]